MTETGYDLAVLMRPAGEARFANVRKLMRLAAEFEAREGRDLRGLLDFLAARAESDAEAQAATAAEGHDGVRIMTVHNAKGLEFDVVAVPDLSRSLLAGARPPLLAARPRAAAAGGDAAAPPRQRRDQPLRLRRAARGGAASATPRRACGSSTSPPPGPGERLILSGVVKPEPGREVKPGTPVVERLVEAPRDRAGRRRRGPGAGARAAARPRGAFAPSEIAVRVNLPSPERAAELTALRRDAAARRPLGAGPPPLVERRPPVVPSRPLSYTAISAYEECAYRFYMERVLGLRRCRRQFSSDSRAITAHGTGDGAVAPSAREERSARGAAVHALLEWSQANDWSEPSAELARRHAGAGRARRRTRPTPPSCSAPCASWLGSPLLRERDRPRRPRGCEPRCRSCSASAAPCCAARSTCWSSARERRRWSSTTRPTGSAARRRRSTPAATGPSARSTPSPSPRRCGAEEVEVAYVFLERPEEPVVSRLGHGGDGRRPRQSLETAIARIGAGEFPVAPVTERSWALCRGCPALGRLCSGPEDQP